MTRVGVAMLLAGAAAVSYAAPRHWTTSWISPAEPAWSSDFVLPLGMPPLLRNVTMRQFLRVSLGGDRVRVVVSNEYGDAPLKVGAVHVGLASSARGLGATFQGAREVIVAAGATAVSDPIALPVAAGARLQIDVYLPQRSQLAGFHWDARDETLMLHGNAAGRPSRDGAEKFAARAFLSAVLVESAQEPVTVVALGDSITDGNGSSPGADHRWPDFLARRLERRGVAVLNAGISGNRLLRAGMGDSALARLDRDVLQHAGVRALIVMIGTNDIGWPGGPFAPDERPPNAAEITAGLHQLAERARVRGVRVVAGTLPPFEDALKGTPLEGHSSPQKESVRQAVNDWIRHSGAFDAVVDFDRLLRDPSRPTRLRAEFDSGDHLHPGDAGYRAMADAVDLDDLLGASGQ
nr:SGNH/GDSL hydrolase family protein [Ramlibacter algicola]